MNNQIVQFKSDTGVDVQITPQDVKNVLCPQANDKEVAMFLELCRAQRLNPFIKDAYLIKYGNNPATIITSKDAFMKRANAQESYEGFESGVTFIDRNGVVQKREGSAVYKAAGEQLVGGWAKVFVKGKKPFYNEVALEEYDTNKSGWARMKGTMIRKVALVQSLREAYAESLQGLYDASEIPDATNYEAQQKKPARYYPSDEEAKASTGAGDFIEVEADVVEDITDEQINRIDVLCYELAGLRGTNKNDVYAALMNSATLKNAGVTSGNMTTQQAALAIQLLENWSSKAKSAAIEQDFTEAEEVEAAGVVEMPLDLETGELYESDVPF